MKRPIYSSSNTTGRSLLLLCILGFLSLALWSCASQKAEEPQPKAEEWYDVLNDYYSDVNTHNQIFYKTVEEPAWEQLFVYDSIFQRTNHPSSISDESLGALVTAADLDSIRARIRESGRVVLDKEQITSLELTRKRNDRSIEISKPIVLGEVAVLRQLGDDAIPIFFLFKEGDKWKVRYTFYQKLELELLPEDAPSSSASKG